MKSLKLLSMVLVTAVVAAACGSGTKAAAPTTAAPATVPTTAVPTTAAPTSPAPACSPSGAALEITAKNTAFDKDCLAAPANTAFTIKFNNQDQASHNVTILDQPGGTALFTGLLFVGPKTSTYKVKALPAGTYYFHCDAHPSEMHGTFIVSE